MKKFVEKLISILKSKHIPYLGMDNSVPYGTEMIKLFDAITIINQLSEEYNNGWIPCNEKMPEEHDSIFAKFKGTDKWNDAMFEKISDVVNVTVVDEIGIELTTYAHTTDGNWSCDLLRYNKLYKIIAWKPLPEPYKQNT